MGGRIGVQTWQGREREYVELQQDNTPHWIKATAMNTAYSAQPRLILP